jgi:hypothetical protein
LSMLMVFVAPGGSVDALCGLMNVAVWVLSDVDVDRGVVQLLPIRNLTNLCQLSIEDNQVESLDGLSPLRSLMELYMGNNCIRGVKVCAGTVLSCRCCCRRCRRRRCCCRYLFVDCIVLVSCVFVVVVVVATAVVVFVSVAAVAGVHTTRLVVVWLLVTSRCRRCETCGICRSSSSSTSLAIHCVAVRSTGCTPSTTSADSRSVCLHACDTATL